MTVDLEKVKDAGYDVTTPVIICNTPDFPDMVCHTGMEVKAQGSCDRVVGQMGWYIEKYS